MAARDKDLYERLRDSGLRKRVAKAVSEATDRRRKAPRQLKRVTNELRDVVADLEDRAKGGPAKRKAAAAKAVRTRQAKARARSSAAKKAARTRARTHA